MFPNDDIKIISIDDYSHLRKPKNPELFQPKTQAEQEEIAYKIIISATGLPDFEEEAHLYHWYATEFCFGQGVEMRDINIERKLRTSDPALQMPF
jgi:hypothetical protein